ncbi:MAG: YbaB/EbfC family nucleoid-associated protein [Anaerolineales bacterium]|nr:YbaB/EbfC family nucleoid-associated protein [Anaerolineales bacterium]
MTKYKGKGIGVPRGGGQSGMLRQLQSLQEDMLKAQEEVTAMVVTASSGGGAVTVVVSGERRVQSITIAPEVVDPEDIEMLQDLIIAAVNDGLEQVDQKAAERMSSITGGLSIPGLT